MKLKKLMLSILVALVTFTLSVGVPAGIRFAIAIIFPLVAKSEIAGRTVPKSVPDSVHAAPRFAEPITVGPRKGEFTSFDVESKRLINRTGKYHMDLKSDPGEFENIDFLEVQTFDFGHDADGSWMKRPIAPEGYIKARTEMKLASLAIGGDEIAFKTVTVDGVSYSFLGQFRNKAYCGIDFNTPGVKGRLMKIIDGEKVGEIEVEFNLVHGC